MSFCLVAHGDTVGSATPHHSMLGPGPADQPRAVACARSRSLRSCGEQLLAPRVGHQALALRLLARSLSHPPDRLGFLSRAALGRLLVESPLLHLAEHALALHLLLEDTQRLLHVVIAHQNLQWTFLSSWIKASRAHWSARGSAVDRVHFVGEAADVERTRPNIGRR